MKPILTHTDWLVYGDSPIPLWAVGVILIFALWMSWSWIRREIRSRSEGLAKVLPWTWGLLVILCAALLWKPNLVRTQTWQRPGRVLAWIDPSASMDSPLAGSTVTSRLDALQFWSPDACKGRPVAPRSLAALLLDLVESGETYRAGMDRLQQELEQGLPMGTDARTLCDAYGAWAPTTRSRITEQATLALDAAAGLSEQAEGKARIRALQGWCDALPESVGEATVEDVRRILGALQTFVEVNRSAGSQLAALQEELDALYLKENGARIEPLLAKVEKRTRRDAAKALLEQLSSRVTVDLQEAGSRNTSDLPGALMDLLRRNENEVYAQTLLFADGGQSRALVASDLASLGEGAPPLLLVGTGLGDAAVDLAIEDWQCPRVMRAGRKNGLTVTIKTPRGRAVPFTVTLSSGETLLHSFDAVSTGLESETLALPFEAPEAGEHELTLEIKTRDAQADNNRVRFALETQKRMPRALLIGETPDWDTAYLTLAAERAGLRLRSVFTGTETPARGSTSGAVPKTVSQWKRFRTVILAGPTFKGWGEKDAAALLKTVRANGAALLLLNGGEGSYVEALATSFGWQAAGAPLDPSQLQIHSDAQALPFLRLGRGSSEFIFGGLGRPAGLRTVPAQTWPILTSTSGSPLLSLGRYGRGRVFVLGAEGLYRLREYGKAATVDRFLTQWLSDAARTLPKDGAETELPYADHQNPGAEEVYYEFSPETLRTMAAATGGSFVDLTDARRRLEEVRPKAWEEKTSTTYSPTMHWGFLALILLIGTAHWAFRKLAGLAI
ncbi:MAG: hypothetical protein ACYTGH_12630 [Planctomycetota bacterium]|jgi:hypothetical protein